MDKTTRRNIEEAYVAKLPYIQRTSECYPELLSMCKNCEQWCGPGHDYTECKGMPCFNFFLAYVYLQWLNTSDGW